MKISFRTEKTTLGRVPVGGIFSYNFKLWSVVNRIDGKNKKLITNIGSGCRENISLASSTKVCYITEVLNIQEGTNESY